MPGCIVHGKPGKTSDIELHYGNWEIKLNYPMLPIILKKKHEESLLFNHNLN